MADPASARQPFFVGPSRGTHLILAVLTVGVWLLAPATLWLWRTGRRKTAGVIAGLVAVVVAAIIVGIVQGPTSKPSATASKSAPATPSASSSSTASASSPSSASASAASSTAAASRPASAPAAKSIAPIERKQADQLAMSLIERALKVIAQDRVDFGDYILTNAFTLGNRDSVLKRTRSLRATATERTFTLSVRSTSGTTFTVRGNGLALTRTCGPRGLGCPAGVWAGSKILVLPKVPVVSAAAKQKIRSILTASVDHYENLLRLGKAALAGERYPDSTAGLAAFADPASGASRFRDYRTGANPENDLSLLDAFKKADSYFAAANEPDAISNWRDDMSEAQSRLIQWVQVAVDWQISSASNAQLAAAEQSFLNGLAKARRDIDQVIAGKSA